MIDMSLLKEQLTYNVRFRGRVMRLGEGVQHHHVLKEHGKEKLSEFRAG
jgi:hypothetical protein